MMNRLASTLLPAAMLFLFWSAAASAQTDTASTSGQEGSAEETPAATQEGFAGQLAEADRLAGGRARPRDLSATGRLAALAWPSALIAAAVWLDE